MFSRALRAVPRAAAPMRAARVPFVPAVRSVTTDAASSQLYQKVPEAEDEPFQVALSDESFETYELDPPPYTLEVTKRELKQMYYDMVSIRYENSIRDSDGHPGCPKQKLLQQRDAITKCQLYT